MNLIIKIFFIYIALFPKLVYSQTTPSGFQTIFYEGFDYPAGQDLYYQSGGNGFTSNWKQSYQKKYLGIRSSGWTYPNLQTTGLRAAYDSSCYGTCNTISSSGRDVPSQTTGVLYLQFLANFGSESGGGSGTPHLRLYDGTDLKLLIGRNTSSSYWELYDHNTQTTVTTDKTLNALRLIIIRLDYDNGGIKMWIDPTLNAFNYSSPPEPTTEIPNISAPSFNNLQIYLRSNSSPGIDEIHAFKSLPSYLNKNGKETSITSEALNSNGSVGSTQAINKFGEEFITKDVITQQGLIMHLDASDVNSYPGSGTTWTDLSGNGNDGTLQNEVSFTADFNGTMNFDGINDYISTPVDADLQVMPSTTWTGWIKPAGGSGWHIVFGMEDGGWDRFLILENATTFALGHTGGRWSPGPNANYSSWQHVAVIYDSGTMRFYLNGSEYTTLINEGSHSSLGTFTIGSNQNGGGNRYKGKIAQVSVYDRVLSAAEINFNFNLNKNKYGL